MISFQLKDREIRTQKRAFVVGIVNVTNDSFYEKSRGGIERALNLIEEGADIIDLGAESTRPGFTEVSVTDEIRRLTPVIREIRRSSDIPISIDTRKKSVFEACFFEGADILNDVSAFSFDSENAKFCSIHNNPVILTHTFPHGRENQDDIINITFDEYSFLSEISLFFENRISFLKNSGFDLSKVIIDPGIGFGKTFEENMFLIKNCKKICGGKYPVMMALSRKRCIGQMIGNMNADRLDATIKANLIAVENGATFLRVHDVFAHSSIL